MGSRLAAARLDAQRIIDNSDVPLGSRDYYDSGPPIIDVNQGIFLNGVGDEDGHEPLCLDRHGNAGYSFVKTARKPYDVVVACILLRAAVLASNCVSLDSDGDWEHDWWIARRLYKNLWGEDVECPWSKTEVETEVADD